MIKKILLGLALTTGLMMASTAKDDLLSLATMGKTAGTAMEMNKSDMEKADGGWYIRGYVQNNINRIQNMMNYNTRSKSTTTSGSTWSKHFGFNNLQTGYFMPANNYYNRVGVNFRR